MPRQPALRILCQFVALILLGVGTPAHAGLASWLKKFVPSGRGNARASTPAVAPEATCEAAVSVQSVPGVTPILAALRLYARGVTVGEVTHVPTLDLRELTRALELGSTAPSVEPAAVSGPITLATKISYGQVSERANVGTINQHGSQAVLQVAQKLAPESKRKFLKMYEEPGLKDFLLPSVESNDLVYALDEGQRWFELNEMIHAMSWIHAVTNVELEVSVEGLLRIVRRVGKLGLDISDVEIFGVKDKDDRVRFALAPRAEQNAGHSDEALARTYELSMVGAAYARVLQEVYDFKPRDFAMVAQHARWLSDHLVYRDNNMYETARTHNNQLINAVTKYDPVLGGVIKCDDVKLRSLHGLTLGTYLAWSEDKEGFIWRSPEMSDVVLSVPLAHAKQGWDRPILPWPHGEPAMVIYRLIDTHDYISSRMTSHQKLPGRG